MHFDPLGIRPLLGSWDVPRSLSALAERNLSVYSLGRADARGITGAVSHPPGHHGPRILPD